MATAVRVTVVGATGRTDLVVPVGARLETVASAYAERLGAVAAPGLFTPTGVRLDPEAAVLDAVSDGDLVVAVLEEPGRATSGQSAGQPVPRRPARPPSVRRLGLGVAAAAAAVIALAVAAHDGADGLVWARPAVIGLLLFVAVCVVAVRPSSSPDSRPDGSPVSRPAVDTDGRSVLVGPAVGAVAAVGATWTNHPGGVVLAVAAGGLGAVVFAALARIWLPEDLEDLGRTWLVGGGVVAATSVAALLLGAGPVPVCAVLFAIAVSAVRLLPATVVDLPDDVLLDLDRLAVTAWSAREQPRGGRRRHQVRVPMVREVAARSARAVSAAVALAAALAAITAPVLVRGDRDATSWGHWGGIALVAAGAAFLALVGRGFRSLAVRAVLGLTALWASGLVAVAVTVQLGVAARWVVFGVAALLTLPVLAAAVRLGRGWRSVWWARVGELLETTTGVLVVALLPLATGLFDVVRVSAGG